MSHPFIHSIFIVCYKIHTVQNLCELNSTPIMNIFSFYLSYHNRVRYICYAFFATKRHFSSAKHSQAEQYFNQNFINKFFF